LNNSQQCPQCGKNFRLFRRSVAGDEGLCDDHGWLPLKPKSRYGRRGFLQLALGVMAAMVLPTPAITVEPLTRAYYVSLQMTVDEATGLWTPSEVPTGLDFKQLLDLSGVVWKKEHA
jgi:hypothetical protein